MRISTILFSVASVAVPLWSPTSGVFAASSGLRTAATTSDIDDTAVDETTFASSSDLDFASDGGQQLKVIVDFNSKDKVNYGPREVALIEEAIILACNEAYPEDLVHCTSAVLNKVTQTPHQMFYPEAVEATSSDVATTSTSAVDTNVDNNNTDDNMDDTTGQLGKRSKKRRDNNWYWSSQTMTVDSHCNLCCDDRFMDAALGRNNRKRKQGGCWRSFMDAVLLGKKKSQYRKDMEDIFLELVHNDSQFASIDDLKIIVKYFDHDIESDDDEDDGDDNSSLISSGPTFDFSPLAEFVNKKNGNDNGKGNGNDDDHVDFNIEVSFKTNSHIDWSGPKMDVLGNAIVSAVNSVYAEDEMHLDDIKIDSVQEEPAALTVTLFGGANDGSNKVEVESGGNDWWNSYASAFSSGQCNLCSDDRRVAEAFYLIGNGPHRKEFEAKFLDLMKNDFEELADLKIKFKVKGDEVPLNAATAFEMEM